MSADIERMSDQWRQDKQDILSRVDRLIEENQRLVKQVAILTERHSAATKDIDRNAEKINVLADESQGLAQNLEKVLHHIELSAHFEEATNADIKKLSVRDRKIMGKLATLSDTMKETTRNLESINKTLTELGERVKSNEDDIKGVKQYFTVFGNIAKFIKWAGGTAAAATALYALFQGFINTKS